MKKIFELINKNLSLPGYLDTLQKKHQGKDLPLITISREKGSGGRLISLLVAKKLGNPWKVFHKEILDEIAKETRLQKELIKQVDENNIAFIDSLISDMFGKRYISLSSYYKHLVKILSTIGNRGFAVIVGRGGHFLFPHSLKVRIICDMDLRIENLMKYEHLSEKQAKDLVAQSDRQRKEFNRTLFNHDVTRAYHYDLVIKTSKDLSIDDASDLIIFAAKKRFVL